MALICSRYYISRTQEHEQAETGKFMIIAIPDANIMWRSAVNKGTLDGEEALWRDILHDVHAGRNRVGMGPSLGKMGPS